MAYSNNRTWNYSIPQVDKIDDYIFQMQGFLTAMKIEYSRMNMTTDTLETYQKFTPTTAVYPKESEENYLLTGLTSEVGELMGAYQKYYRGDFEEDELRDRIIKELGDVMWHISQLCNYEGLSISNILEVNQEKLKSRVASGTIKGDGDER